MITPQTIGNILYRDCKSLGIQTINVVFPGDNSSEIKAGEVTEQRIVIHVKSQKPGTYWRKSYNEINILIPRIADKPDRITAEEMEQRAQAIFEDAVGSFNGVTYKYTIDSLGTMTDDALRCEYVNARLLFEVLNVK